MTKFNNDLAKAGVITGGVVVVLMIIFISFFISYTISRPLPTEAQVSASTVEGEVMKIEPSQTYVIEENTSEAQPMFDFVYSRPNCQIGYFVDQETGVNYIIVFANDGGLCITPRLDSNGDICVSEGTLYIENEDLETYHP